MMLVLEPNGTLVMYCGMVKVYFADSIFLLDSQIPIHGLLAKISLFLFQIKI